jgi:hypothetical protein
VLYPCMSPFLGFRKTEDKLPRRWSGSKSGSQRRVELEFVKCEEMRWESLREAKRLRGELRLEEKT